MSAKWTPLFPPPIQNATSRPSMRTVGLSTTPVGPASGLPENDSSVERNHVPLFACGRPVLYSVARSVTTFSNAPSTISHPWSEPFSKSNRTRPASAATEKPAPAMQIAADSVLPNKVLMGVSVAKLRRRHKRDMHFWRSLGAFFTHAF